MNEINKLDEHAQEEINRFMGNLPLTKAVDPYDLETFMPITIPAVSDEVWVIEYVSLGENMFAYRFSDNHDVGPWLIGTSEDIVISYKDFIQEYKNFLSYKPEPDVDYSQPDIQ